MNTAATIVVIILSIIFVILAPLVMFGYSTKPLFYEPKLMTDILERNGFFEALSPPKMGDDIISVAQAEAFSEVLSLSVPQMLAYLTGENDEIKVILKTDTLRAAVIESARRGLEQRLSEVPICSDNEEPQFISMKEFTCMPLSGQDKEMALNIAMSQVSQFLNLDEIEDIDLSSQIKGILDGLSPVKRIIQAGFRILEASLLVLALLLLGIVAVKRSWKASKIIGTLLIWVGISIYIVTLVMPVILQRIISGQANIILNGIINDVIAVIISNAQAYAISSVIIGIVLIIIYYYVGKEFEKSKVKKNKKR